ncbi:zinc-binding metallopeptidase family protein [Methylobacterium oryzihabitans]|uniref:Zinc-ribbon domain-containing protein n=1 Tax=Methylobacterium oryzihabitans TaxID=2499852 RepID=A0A437P2Z5_9HYPH|nr:putative zinc-binding peptidase [Methylobacterium oryzihabitans]RVU16586.1 hypothetical protein EOE48_16020 [Methylobacterium oryzihabitans]
MKLFQCQSCGNILYFENRTCERCGHRLAYLPETGMLSALEPAGGTSWTPLAASDRPGLFCTNADHDACNWLVPPGTSDAFCLACRHNGTIPDVSNPTYLEAWRQLEFAKHRLFYTLLRWNLPLKTRAEDPEHGLIFHFLADPPENQGPKVMTGHDNGVITIALVEADDAEREKRRSQMGEPYRTLLGHFRHEVGHHYWDVLVRDAGRLDACRAVFGDDSQDYNAALQRHYDQGPPPNWQDSFVSAYATTHPWEDFAETWAHYLHIVDTLEMASAFGMQVNPLVDASGNLAGRIDFDPYRAESIGQIVDAWLPVVFALNSVNRAMGHADLYPFVLAPPVVTKLGFIHDLVHGKV